jgi:hypothetical protein
MSKRFLGQGNWQAIVDYRIKPWAMDHSFLTDWNRQELEWGALFLINSMISFLGFADFPT